MGAWAKAAPPVRSVAQRMSLASSFMAAFYLHSNQRNFCRKVVVLASANPRPPWGAVRRICSRAKGLREGGRFAAHPEAQLIDAAGDAEDSEERR